MKDQVSMCCLGINVFHSFLWQVKTTIPYLIKSMISASRIGSWFLVLRREQAKPVCELHRVWHHASLLEVYVILESEHDSRNAHAEKERKREIDRNREREEETSRETIKILLPPSLTWYQDFDRQIKSVSVRSLRNENLDWKQFQFSLIGIQFQCFIVNMSTTTFHSHTRFLVSVNKFLWLFVIVCCEK